MKDDITVEKLSIACSLDNGPSREQFVEKVVVKEVYAPCTD